jgi:hypothetical protein
MSINLRNKQVVIVTTLLAAMILASCSNSDSSSEASSETTKIDCTGDGSIEGVLGDKSLPFDCEVPAFPTQIKDYVLDRTVDGQEIRIFEGDKWRPFLTPYRGGNSLSCQPAIWVVRWRSQNPSVQIRISGTYGGFDVGEPTDALGDPRTDGDFNEDTDWVAFYEPETGDGSVGSAGYIAAPSCAQPVMKWESNPAGDASLADISFEYQIWTYKQKI